MPLTDMLKPCENSPCENGGTCSNVATAKPWIFDYECTCTDEYTGVNCERGLSVVCMCGSAFNGTFHSENRLSFLGPPSKKALYYIFPNKI